MAQAGADSYTLRMIDQMTAPLRKIEAQMEKVAGLMEKLHGKADGSSKGFLGGIGKGALIAGAAIGGVALAIKGVVDLLGWGIGKVFQFASAFGRLVIETAKFRQQNITALDAFLGKGRGERAFNQALTIGGITPMNEMDVVRQVRDLSAAGYKGRGLSAVNAALTDVHAMLGDESRGNLQYYFQKFFGGRKVEADDLRMASFSAGLQETEVMKQVLKAKGKSTTGTPFAMGKVFDQLKKEGKVTGQDIVQALLQGIDEKLSGGKGLGSAAKKQAGTLGGLLSNLESAPMRFMAQMKLEKLPGIQSLMEFLKKLLTFFDHATPQGKQLAQVVEKITNALFKGLDRITPDRLQKFFEAGLRVAEKLVKSIESMWTALDALLGGEGDLLTAAKEVFLAIGRLVGQGIWEGFKLAAGFGGPAASTQQKAFQGAYGKEQGDKLFFQLNPGLRPSAQTFAPTTMPREQRQLSREAAGALAARSGPAPLNVRIDHITLAGDDDDQRAKDFGRKMGEQVRRASDRSAQEASP